ncbi:MAG: adenylate kinase [Candidatus Micrarchaeota archaeon]
MIIIMGLPGAGKSTVLAGIKKLQPEYKFQNYGDLMFEIEKEKYGIQNRDDMRKLPIEKQKEVQKHVADRLSKEHGKFVLDTHCSVNTPKGYFPGLPHSLLSKLKVDALVLITTTAEDINQRRNADSTRVRDEQSVESIMEHDLINRSFLAAYSALTGAPAVIVYNRNGKLEEAVKKLNSIF